MLAFLIKACVAALVKFPEFNASLDNDNLVLKQYFHIGFAADTPNGLVVPVIRNADQKGVLQIAKEMGELSAKARDGKLGPADMRAAAFRSPAWAASAALYFTPIINAPEVAILGVSRSANEPVWNGRQFVPRLMLPLSLSYDHRVIDGAAAARFNSFLAALLADMRRSCCDQARPGWHRAGVAARRPQPWRGKRAGVVRRCRSEARERHAGSLSGGVFFGAAMSTIEVKVPDIGDFKDMPVIEVFVKPGDTVKAEDSLVTLESDKATMDVPAPAAGVVKELKVKVGDKVRRRQSRS